ncbi:MAG: hypothetical protein NTW97_12135 [Candidatus Krumholzibacteria bacterium]|nr:hypothetical protein [Candidatus Krumholzibacteria bacterium]
MARTRFHRRARLLVPSLVVLAALVVIYLPVRVRMAGSERSREAPPPGTALSIFFTNQLAGYREPCS